MAGCCNRTVKLNVTNTMREIPKDKVQITNEFYIWFKDAKNRAGISARYSTVDCVQIVNYHNDIYGTSFSEHNINDLKQCMMNCKVLYNQIKNGEVLYEMDEPINIEVPKDEILLKEDMEIILENEQAIVEEEKKTILSTAEENVKKYVDIGEDKYVCPVCGEYKTHLAKLCPICKFKQTKK